MSDVATAAEAWLLGDGLGVRFLEDVYAEVCTRLRDGGLPLDRATLHVRALHPQFRAARFLWEPGFERAELTRVGGDVLRSERFLNSPVRALYEGAEGLRQRLDLPLADDAYAILGELRAHGYTDYAGLPLVFSNGQRIASSWATRRPNGFSTGELLALDRLRPLLGMAAEIRIVRRTSRNIVDTYLGPRAGARVLDGRIQRGDVETLDAVVYYLDMRDFTGFAERTPSAGVIERLNRFFDAFAPAIAEAGGEILKFTGDGILAIFSAEDDPTAAADRAIAASLAGLHGLAVLNRTLEEAAEERIGCGLALHRGRVAFGNIGTPDRLDFTVIGPVVNVASRLQHLARDLGEALVLSEAVASATSRATRSLGRHGLRGLPEAIRVFAPPLEALP